MLCRGDGNVLKVYSESREFGKFWQITFQLRTKGQVVLSEFGEWSEKYSRQRTTEQRS